MNCRSVHIKFAAYLDRELRKEESEEIRAHLHCCSDCEAELHRVQAIKDQVAMLLPIPPTKDFETRLFGAIEGLGDQPTRSSWWDWRFALVPATAVAAAYMFFVIGKSSPATPEPANVLSQNNSLARDQAFDQARNPMSGGMTVSFDAPSGR